MPNLCALSSLVILLLLVGCSASPTLIASSPTETPVPPLQPNPVLQRAEENKDLQESYQKFSNQMGRQLLKPGLLPAGYQFAFMEKVPDRSQVIIQYQPAASQANGPILSIHQILLSSLPPIKLSKNPPEFMKFVDISGKQGRWQPAVQDGAGCYPSWWLMWETSDLAMSLYLCPEPNVSAEEAFGRMVEIARSMK